MPYQKYNEVTGELGEGRANLPIQFDPATEAIVEVETYQDPLVKKVAAGIVVDKTTLEIEAQAAATLDLEASGSFDQNKLLRAVVIYMVQRLNELRTQPAQAFTALTAVQVRAGIITIYKTL